MLIEGFYHWAVSAISNISLGKSYWSRGQLPNGHTTDYATGSGCKNSATVSEINVAS